MAQILQGNDNASIEKALELLKSNEVVALPTETVYGLAANAYSGIAIAKIFEIKKRPSFNPLIVHYLNLAQSENDVIWNNEAKKLYEKFSPGALTYVLPIRENSRISPLATAGLSSLAVRFPKKELFRTILGSLDFPLAAPSANSSGKISPTMAEHVYMSLQDANISILDGGKSELGIESTIISFLDKPKILRSGVITKEEIESVIGNLENHEDGKIIAPGMLKKHYAPSKKIRLNATEVHNDEVLICFGTSPNINNNSDCLINLSKDGNLLEAASNLFEALWLAENHSKPKIAIMKIPELGIGIAINDRLKRASY